MTDKPEFLLIASRMTSSNWAALQHHVERIVSTSDGKVANPEFGMFVINPTGSAFWSAQELCDILRRHDVPFVQAKISTPLSGFLSETGRKALQDMGVEFWNKDE